MANIKVLLWFDLEDYITPESEEVLLPLLELLERKGIKVTFKIVGEAIRRLKLHGRNNILEKLINHDIGYHTDMHSQHPVVSEYLEPLGFRDGTYEFEKREYGGYKDVVEITGKQAVCYGQPGYSWAPQPYAVLKKWNIPVYLDCMDIICLEKKPFWYCGMIDFNNILGLMRMELVDGGLEKAKMDFDRICERLSNENTGFVSIFYHPNEFSTMEFWDMLNFAGGVNVTEEKWRKPVRISFTRSLYLIEMLGQFIDYISAKGAEFVAASGIPAMENSCGCGIMKDDVRGIAASLYDRLNFISYDGHSFSTADIFSLFSKYLNGLELKPETIFGPENDFNSDFALTVRVGDVIKAINFHYPSVCGYKQLPDYFVVGDKRINPIDMTCIMANIIRKELSSDDEMGMIRGCLKSTDYMEKDTEWGRRWGIFNKDFKANNIIRVGRLQTWTLKPAIF